MMELFSKKFGVDSPGKNTRQVMADDFVAAAWRIQRHHQLQHFPRSSQVAPRIFNRPRRLDLHELGTSVRRSRHHQRTGATSAHEGFPRSWKLYGPIAHFGKDQADYEALE